LCSGGARVQNLQRFCRRDYIADIADIAFWQQKSYPQI
jgi:hypothetical protein